MTVSGKVQGVGFRYHTKQLADQLQIKGSVKNETNGDVYIEAIGTTETIDQFIQQIKTSSFPFSHVEKIKLEVEDTLPPALNFKITY